MAAAAEIVAVPGLDGIMIGPADWPRPGPGRPDPAGVDRRGAPPSSPAGSLRMDIVRGPTQARAAFDDGAQLVVYNLTHTLMDHLAELRGSTA